MPGPFLQGRAKRKGFYSEKTLVVLVLNLCPLKRNLHGPFNKCLMKLVRTVLLVLSLVSYAFVSFAQTERSKLLLRHLSKEDRFAFLMYKSKHEKSKAIGAAVAGPVLSGFGLYLLGKEGSITNGQNDSPVRLYGVLLGSLGLMVSISSISLFCSAGKTKREAQLLLSTSSSVRVGTRLPVPGIGLRIRF